MSESLICGKLRIASVHTRPHQVSDRCALLVHGGPGGDKNGPGDLFVGLATELADAGIASLRFDMLGAGQSEGDYVEMTLADQGEQVGAVARFVRHLGYRRLGVVGESLGAAVVLLGWPGDARAGVLLWPTIDLSNTSLGVYLEPQYQEQLRQHGYVRDGEERIGRSFIEEIQRFGSLEGRLADLDTPMLLIHGEADTEVPHEQSRHAYEMLPEPRRLVLLPGGEHGLRESAEQQVVCREVTEWLVRYL